MRHHLQEQHPSWESNTDSLEVQDFSGKISITNEEETKLGIPEKSHGRCVVAINAYNMRRSHSLPHIHNSHGESPRRPHYTMPVLGLQYSVTTMMSSLDSVIISVYFFACVTYIVKSHS